MVRCALCPCVVGALFAWFVIACGGDDAVLPGEHAAGSGGSNGEGGAGSRGTVDTSGAGASPTANGIGEPSASGIVLDASIVGDVRVDANATPAEAGLTSDALASTKPRVWVSSDLTDPQSANATDTDDIVTMSAFLLTANRVNVQGVVVGATPFTSCHSSLAWINANVASAYAKEVASLNAKIGGYPSVVPFLEASTCGHKFDATSSVNLDSLPTVKALVDAAKAGPLVILNWSPMTETASAIQYLLSQKDMGTLDNVTIVSHWTSPATQYNCNVDAAACAYLHQQASAGAIKLYELGPMGQTGLVDNGCHSPVNLSQSMMSVGAIGKLMSVKWNGNGWPDMSDGATFFVLDGFGGGLRILKSDGTVDSAGYDRLCNDRAKLAPLLEGAAKAAAGL
jgi:hypothetical protein